MGELVASTGKPPIVVYDLPLGAWISKTPGFNNYNPTESEAEGDCSQLNDKINKRVNPNLPPKEKACVHQLENNSADCPVMCVNQCKPVGYNILVYWDKAHKMKDTSFIQ